MRLNDRQDSKTQLAPNQFSERGLHRHKRVRSPAPCITLVTSLHFFAYSNLVETVDARLIGD